MSKYFLLGYDVPTNAKIEHPVTVLHRRALRFQLSLWLISEDNIPWNYLERLEKVAIWDLVPFADEMTAQVESIIVRNIKRELEKAQERETASLDRLDTQEQEAGTEEGWKIKQKRDKERQNVLKRSEKFLKGL